MLSQWLLSCGTVALLAASALSSPVAPHSDQPVTVHFLGGRLDGRTVENYNGTLPADIRSHLEQESHMLQRRGNVQTSGNTRCRDLTTADLYGLNDAQLQVFLNRLNSAFVLDVYQGFWSADRNIRRFRDAAFGGNQGGWGGLNAEVSPVSKYDINQFINLSPAKICLDASKIEIVSPYFEDPDRCMVTTMTAQGQLSDQGEVQISVTQGYTISATVSSETTNTVGTEISVDVGVDFEVVSVGASVTLSYETSSTQGKEDTTEKSVENTVSVTINPPAGYNCSMDITQTTCSGEMQLSVPYTYPSGYILVDFFFNTAMTAAWGGTGYSQHMWFLEVSDLLSNLPDNNVQNIVQTTIGSSGTYHQHCTPSNGDPLQPGGISTAYVPSLTCPKTLEVIQGQCSSPAADYIGTGLVVGDTSAWADNGAVIEQFPATGSPLPFGQSTVTFNVSTPYHYTACTSLAQVVPPWGSTFLPQDINLALPQDNSKVVTGYSVGYVSQCGLSQHGTCSITNIQARSTPDFHWTQTSPIGNPVQEFEFTGTWPESERLTFEITCTDMYGNSGKVQNFQAAYRADVATETVTAQTATQTFHSTTQYLYTSVKTLLTSIITPAVTQTLRTDTLYTGTSYTSTRTVTDFDAKKFSATARVTDTTETETIRSTRTLHPTITPEAKTIVTTKTSVPTSTVVVSSGVKTVSRTSTKVSTINAKPTPCDDGDRQALKAAELLVVKTTTLVDQTGTKTITDFYGTATTLLSATTTSTNNVDVFSTTLSTTSTVYDPIHTAITSGLKLDASTKVLDSYTVTTTKHLTASTSVSSIRTKTEPTTVRTPTVYSTSTRVRPTTITITKPARTSTKWVATTTVRTTVTPACTP